MHSALCRLHDHIDDWQQFPVSWCQEIKERKNCWISTKTLLLLTIFVIVLLPCEPMPERVGINWVDRSPCANHPYKGWFTSQWNCISHYYLHSPFRFPLFLSFLQALWWAAPRSESRWLCEYSCRGCGCNFKAVGQVKTLGKLTEDRKMAGLAWTKPCILFALVTCLHSVFHAVILEFFFSKCV